MMTPERFAELKQNLDEDYVLTLEEGTEALAEIERLQAELAEMNALFDLRWKADMRAIERWRAEQPAERKLRQPDHFDMVVWLMKELSNWDEAKTRLARIAGLRVERTESAGGDNPAPPGRKPKS